MLLEVGVAEFEVMVAKEATVGAEGTGVSRLQNEVARLIDESSLLAGWSSPKEENEVVATVGEAFDDSIGECLPSLAAMTEGLVSTNAETSVEQEDALVNP